MSKLDDNALKGLADCTLLIPAYNEQDRIRTLFSDIRGSDGHFLFICDGTDDTARKVREFGQKNPEMDIRCLEFHQRLGKGGAIKAGMRESKTPFTGYMDADGSTSIKEMQVLRDQLAGADGVIGSRYLEGSRITTPQGFLRRLESRVFNLLIRVLFGISFHDTQCGAKVFRTDALHSVLPEIRSDGFELDVELVWRLEKEGYTVREYPITWNNMGDSRVRGQDAGSMLANLVKIRFGW